MFILFILRHHIHQNFHICCGVIAIVFINIIMPKPNHVLKYKEKRFALIFVYINIDSRIFSIH